MHLAEGTLPLLQATGWSILAAPAVAWSMRAERQGGAAGPHAGVLMAGATSMLFAATLLPIPVPVVGATSHLCLTPVLALMVGARRIVWPTFFVLLLQAVFFGHGGLTTLGVNTLALGVVGPMVTLGLWYLFRRFGVHQTVGIALACGLGGMSVYVADAMVLAVALSELAAPSTTFITVVAGFAPIQIPIALLEAGVSVGLVRLLAARRPNLLPPLLRNPGGSSKLAGAYSLVLMGVGLSGCNYEGMDETVFGATATQAGRPPSQSLVDFSQGELGVAMSVIILFGLGFVAGRSWERSSQGGDDALPR